MGRQQPAMEFVCFYGGNNRYVEVICIHEAATTSNGSKWKRL
jgi:hypothetical protein